MKKIFLINVFALCLASTMFSIEFSPLQENAFNGVQKIDIQKMSAKEYFEGSGKYFKLNPITDPILFGTGTALLITTFCVKNGKEKTFAGNVLDKNDVNAFDRKFMKPYSKKIDIAGSVLQAVGIASPLILFATDKHEWITIFTMYAETMLLAHVAKAMIKTFVFRPRPYMYFDNYPQKYVDSGDWCNSFPSGHTTMAFAAAGFTSFVFGTYFPRSLWNIPVVLSSYAIAGTIAALRMLSGNHFATDVIVGACIGTVIGIGVPLLHKIGVQKNASKDDKVELTLSPMGITGTLRF